MKIGKIIKGTGRILGTVVEFKIKLTGEVIGAVADVTNKPKFAEGSRKFTNAVGGAIGDGTRVMAHVAGDVVDKTIDASSKAAKKLGKAIVKENITIIDENGEARNIKYVDDVKYEIIEDDDKNCSTKFECT